QRAVFFQLANHVADRGGFLANSDVNAGNALAFLADDGVDGYGGLACLAVTDDELALATANRNHGVDGLDAGSQRLRHRLTGNHARRDFLDDVGGLGVDGTLAVDG